MARRLVDAGYDVVVFNRTRERAAALEEAGARVARSPAEVACGADAVLTMLADPAALEAVARGAGGLIEGIAAPTAVIEMSTVGPAAIADLAASLPRGVGLLDAPVLGSTGEAEAGELRIFVGGDRELAARFAPFLRVLGAPVDVGPSGSGAAAKLVANATLFGTLGVLGEALALADGLGLDRQTAFEVLAATPIAAQAERRRPAIESGEFPPRFKLRLASKDSRLVLDAAEGSGADMRLIRAAAAWLADAEAAGAGEEDYTAMLGQILGRD